MRETFGGGLIITGAAHNVGAGGGEGVDLLEGALDVGRLGRGHRLDADGGIPTDEYGANGDLAGATAWRERSGGYVHVSILPCLVGRRALPSGRG